MRDHTIHLVMDENHALALCSGEPWSPPETRDGDRAVFCEACRLIALRKMNRPADTNTTERQA